MNAPSKMPKNGQIRANLATWEQSLARGPANSARKVMAKQATS